VNRTALTIGVVLLVALAGCSALPGGSGGGAETGDADEQVEVDNPEEPGEYTVETHVTDNQAANATVTIE
jgi:hypothetical protein